MYVDISKYKQLQEMNRKHFQDQKTGEQTFQEETNRLFKPVVNTSNQLNQTLLSNQQQLSNTLLPIANRLEQRIDLLQNLQSLPYYYTPAETEAISQHSSIPHSSTPRGKTSDIHVNVDVDLNLTDKENLEDLGLDLPSVVLDKQSYKYTLEAITTKNRQLGQFLRADSRKTDKERQVFMSQRETLAKYRNSIENLRGAQPFIQKSGEGVVFVKQKRGRGRPRTKPEPIVYKTPNDLLKKLEEHVEAYRAGNNGVHNTIVSMLDELLLKKNIDKERYDNLFKNIFN